MRILTFLLVLLSFFMGIPTNKGWFTLYGTEFSGPISMLKAGNFPSNLFYLWILLLLSHLSIVLLPFLINKNYYKYLLYFCPLIFIGSYTIFAPLTLLFLIHFIIVWIILMFKTKAHHQK